ncbi:WD40 repeat-like protein [Choiromyces venosus 120613-1]|uniref:WD40 repeat-like protein n=1 Tax=Choiromyces venosus 120613-1 TaxID=1336337 RepID=A0A3N4JT34_9PEZI|nr:WD40 repeat-like protein [Choiromyces venosus 120613-1]
MSMSNDPGNFFQTETALANAERRAAKSSNKNGSPITLTSKLLSIIPDPTSSMRVYIAESGGITRRVDLESGDKSCIYKGHTAPVTSLALNAAQGVLFTGSWDKTINAYSTETRQKLRTFVGHSDFVKSLLFVPSPKHEGGLLISGSSDASIIIWGAGTGQRLNTLKGHNRAVGALAIDPVASDSETAIIYSGGSERDIKRWEIPYANVGAATESGETIMEHDTSVNMIRFQGEDADMWTASVDNTARRIDIRTEVKKNGTSRSDTVLKHPDYVNDVVVEPRGRWVITACRDEEVRVWDISTGELYHVYDGHIEEITGLAIIGKGEMVASISIDNTVRKWSLRPADLTKAVEEKKLQEQGIKKEPVQEKKESLLTEEEERELAELMDDSDD